MSFRHVLRMCCPLPCSSSPGLSSPTESVISPLFPETIRLIILKTNIDWAGILVERVTGMSLNDYFQQHIFAPLGIKNISFFPTAEMKSKLVHISQRAKDGTLTPREHLLRMPLVTEFGSHEQQRLFSSGGGGCFAQPKEYVKIIAMVRILDSFSSYFRPFQQLLNTQNRPRRFSIMCKYF